MNSEAGVRSTSLSHNARSSLLVVVRFEWSVLGYPEVLGLVLAQLREVDIKSRQMKAGHILI